MHGTTTHRKGYEYKKYYCSKKCGVGMVDMEKIDTAVKKYIKALLEEDNIHKLTLTLQEYIAGEKNRTEDFNKAIRSEINNKQKQIENYMTTLGSGLLPAEVISDIGEKIVALKNEIKNLELAEPPKDFTADQIKNWLNVIRNAADDKVVRLLIDRIDVNKTEVNIQSTLTSVVGKIGRGDRI